MRSRLALTIVAITLLTLLAAASRAQDAQQLIEPPAQFAEGTAPVEGGDVYYQVHGDLRSGKTPLLVLHGSFMHGEFMRPIAKPFFEDRPVILVDQRGHGRTGDLPGPITYEILADDAAAVLDSLGIERADVLGYSMGCNAALFMAVRHPKRVRKLIAISGTFSKSGWYPAILAAFDKWTPEAFAGGPLEAEYKRLSPDPGQFGTLVEELRVLDTAAADIPDQSLRAIGARTMIIMGDADGVTLEHTINLFKLRGGGTEEIALKGILTEPPRARLAILPATTHVGVLGEGDLIHALVTPFLDDKVKPTPPGFFAEPTQPEGSKP